MRWGLSTPVLKLICSCRNPNCWCYTYYAGSTNIGLLLAVKIPAGCLYNLIFALWAIFHLLALADFKFINDSSAHLAHLDALNKVSTSPIINLFFAGILTCPESPMENPMRKIGRATIQNTRNTFLLVCFFPFFFFSIKCYCNTPSLWWLLVVWFTLWNFQVDIQNQPHFCLQSGDLLS